MSDRANSKGDGEDLGPDLSKLLVWILAAALVFMLVVLAVYVLRFGTAPFSDDPSAWGQFGDFMGGTLNPLLAFLTLIALTATITLQFRQLAISAKELRLSRQELHETRAELQRSAKAQELSEAALRAQAETARQSAKLTAANYLLGVYTAELGKLQRSAWDADNTETQVAFDRINARVKAMRNVLDNAFDEVVKVDNPSNDPNG
jgi:fumarate reductase subunit C